MQGGQLCMWSLKLSRQEEFEEKEGVTLSTKYLLARISAAAMLSSQEW